MSRAALWLGATRPAFLSITLLAVLLGFSHAAWRQPAPASLLVVVLTLIGALLAHAAANVLNDVADADSGCDAANTERVAPFTGGSRVIQQGLLSRDAMLRFGWTLLAASAACGLALLALTDLRLLGFGIGGLLLAAAYSLPPLKLMARGLGELAVILGWLLIVAGSDFVLRRQLDPSAWLAGLPFALQIGMILLVNQVPDRQADLGAGKRNWTVRLAANDAALPYALLWLGSGLAVFGGWWFGALPAGALVALTAIPIGYVASRQIHRWAQSPAQLLSPIRLTLLQAHLVGALLALGLLGDHLFRTSP